MNRGIFPGAAIPATDPAGDPPIASGIIRGSAYLDYTGSAFGTYIPMVTHVNNTSAAFVDAVNYSGSGVLESCIHFMSSGTNSRTGTIEIWIDGKLVYTNTSPAAVSKTYAMAVTGMVQPLDILGTLQYYAVFDGSAIPFRHSLQIRHKVSVADGGASSQVQYTYRKTR